MHGTNWMFVAAAYAAAWIVVVGYAVHVHRALGRARRALWHATGPTWTEGPWR